MSIQKALLSLPLQYQIAPECLRRIYFNAGIFIILASICSGYLCFQAQIGDDFFSYIITLVGTISGSILCIQAGTTKRISEREFLLRKFLKLPEISDSSFQYEECDSFDIAIPSQAHRILLKNGPTNGAQINDKMILISAPQNEEELRILKEIVKEKHCQGIIRLGDEDYIDTSTNMGIEVRSFKEWSDGGICNVDKLHRFILDTMSLYNKGPIIVHCVAGMGRSGVFAICFEIYLTLKNANKTVKIDPVDLIKILRKKRGGCVETAEQFNLILDYIDHLNYFYDNDQTN